MHSPSVTGCCGLMFCVSGCERSRIFSMVGLVVPISLETCASDSSGWVRISQAMAFGLSCRRLIGV